MGINVRCINPGQCYNILLVVDNSAINRTESKREEVVRIQVREDGIHRKGVNDEKMWGGKGKMWENGELIGE